MTASSSSSSHLSPRQPSSSANVPAGREINRISTPDLDHLGEYRGGPSPSPSVGSTGTGNGGGGGRRSKRDLIRSKHPPPHHVSKLEHLLDSPSSSKRKGKAKEKNEDGDAHIVTTDVGILPDEVYDEYLPPAVAYVRRWLVWSLRKESLFLAWHQPKVRTPFLDRYFVYTSLFGTHSFFLIFLPSAFWIGNRFFGRGLVHELALGVYLSSAIKDLLCVPRPYSPPVTRLTVGTTHLEFGFPSTHSTNSVGTAVYVYLWIVALRQRPDVSALLSVGAFNSPLWEVGLSLYACSVVYGRIYAGMHSMMDCFAGSILGAALALTQWYGADAIEGFLEIEGWTVPLVLIPSCLFMVYVHPQPLDDCPCFEDAIAFVSVLLGTSLARWASLRWNWFGRLNENPFEPDRFSMKELPLSSSTLFDKLISTGWTLLTIITGVACIFCVRVVIKTSCKLLLPSMFRFVDRSFGLVLPRRHYVPSSEYTDVPMNNIIRSPSFMDLPSSLTPTVTPAANPGQEASTSTGIHARLAGLQDQERPQSPGSVMSDDEGISRPGSPDSNSGIVSGTSIRSNVSDIHQRRVSSSGPPRSETSSPFLQQFPPKPKSSLSVPITHPIGQGGAELPSDRVSKAIAGTLSEDEQKRQAALDAGLVTHYDIDVLTKVLVYSNIGFFAAGVIPAFFEYIGLTSP